MYFAYHDYVSSAMLYVISLSRSSGKHLKTEKEVRQQSLDRCEDWYKQ